jgi:hypothetical protein
MNEHASVIKNPACMRDEAALLKEIEDLKNQNEFLQEELVEQARLLGIGGSIEARLIAEKEEIRRELAREVAALITQVEELEGKFNDALVHRYSQEEVDLWLARYINGGRPDKTLPEWVSKYRENQPECLNCGYILELHKAKLSNSRNGGFRKVCKKCGFVGAPFVRSL